MEHIESLRSFSRGQDLIEHARKLMGKNRPPRLVGLLPVASAIYTKFWEFMEKEPWDYETIRAINTYGSPEFHCEHTGFAIKFWGEIVLVYHHKEPVFFQGHPVFFPGFLYFDCTNNNTLDGFNDGFLRFIDELEDNRDGLLETARAEILRESGGKQEHFSSEFAKFYGFQK